MASILEKDLHNEIIKKRKGYKTEFHSSKWTMPNTSYEDLADIISINDIQELSNFLTSHGAVKSSTDDVALISGFKVLQFIGEEEFNFKYQGFSCTIPKKLKIVYDTLNKSLDLMSLDENWDDSGAEKISLATWKKFANFLIKYSVWISENLNLQIDMPSVNAVPDGSIDITWHSQKARLLINIRNSDQAIAHYYGDLYSEANKFKGTIDLNKFQDFFAYWLLNISK